MRIEIKKIKMAAKIAVMGNKGVGKSALVNRCINNRPESESPPGKDVAYQFSTAKNITIDIIDFNGKNDALISCADGFIICYSITDRESFNMIEEFLRTVLEANIKRPKIAIIGNKNDLLSQRRVATSEGLNLAKEINALFYETSAYTPTMDIRQAFLDLNKAIIRSKKRRGKSYDTENILIDQYLDKSVINTGRGKQRDIQESIGTIKRKVLQSNYRPHSFDS